MKKKLIAEELAEKTLRELREIKIKPVNSPKLPFRIPVLEKTFRQAQSTQGYKASAYWQTASLLRDLIQLYLEIIPASQFRRKTQLEDAARSMVATIEEGWARPSTKEYLDYLGFAQASLTEVRGDIERLYTDGYLKAGKLFIPTPSLKFPYPPVNSRINPTKYGTIRERLREYTGKEIQAKDLTYELFIEFINKTDYLLKNTVFGLQGRIIKNEKSKL
jgi:four helix bundle protein